MDSDSGSGGSGGGKVPILCVCVVLLAPALSIRPQRRTDFFRWREGPTALIMNCTKFCMELISVNGDDEDSGAYNGFGKVKTLITLCVLWSFFRCWH